MSVQRHIPYHAGWRLVIFAGLGAAVTDFLFYRHPLGLNTALFGTGLLGSILLTNAGRHRFGTAAAWLVALLLPLLLVNAWRVSGTALLLAACGLCMLQWTLRAGWTAHGTVWLGRLAAATVAAWARPLQDHRLIQRLQRGGRPGVAAAAAVTLGRWLLPVVLSAVFVGLFAVANPLIAKWLNAGWTRLSRFLAHLDLPAADRLLLWFLAFMLFWGLIRLRPNGIRLPRPPAEPVSTPPEAPGGEALTVRCLGLFNLVFALQNLLDARYLMGGAQLPEGMSYAEYAHRGAYPLVVTALLAAAFLLWAFAPTGAAQHSRAARALVYLWVAQNIFLMLSAVWRLCLYIDVYSLTRWRAAAAVWMLLVALGLLWICLRIGLARSNGWLVNVNALTLAAVLYACAFVNWPGFIAAYNAQHCEEVRGDGPMLDYRYMQALGQEALPALLWYGQHARPVRAPDSYRETVNALETHLDVHLGDWRGWSWRAGAIARQCRPPGPDGR